MDETLPSLFTVVAEKGEEYLRPFATERRFDQLHYETEIERWVKNSLKRREPVLGDIAVFGQQVRFGGGSQRAVDLLSIDEAKNVVVVEFKRAETDESIVFQVLNYCSWIAEQPYEVLNEKAVEFFRKEKFPYRSLKDLYVKSFGALDVQASEAEAGEGLSVTMPEAEEMSDEEFKKGFNSRPRIVVVAAAVSGEVKRIISFLAQRSNLDIQAHEFKFFETEKGEKLISRAAVSVAATRQPTAAADADWSLERVEEWVKNPVVRGMIRDLLKWCEEEFDKQDVDMYYTSYSGFNIRVAGRVRFSLYYAKQWMFVWLNHRFEGDVDWLRGRLSKPGEVKVDKNSVARFHVSTAEDLVLLKELIKRVLQEVTVATG